MFILIDRDVKDTTWLDLLTAFGPIFAVIVTSALTLYLFNRSMKQQRKDLDSTFDGQNELLQKQISDNIIFQERANNLEKVQDITLEFYALNNRFAANIQFRRTMDIDDHFSQWTKLNGKLGFVIGKDKEGESRKHELVNMSVKIAKKQNLLLVISIGDYAKEIALSISKNDKELLPASWMRLDKNIRDDFFEEYKGWKFDGATIIKLAQHNLIESMNEFMDASKEYIDIERRSIAKGEK